jgi:IPT/TIG domain
MKHRSRQGCDAACAKRGRQGRSSRFAVVVVAFASVWALIGASSAGASTVTVGSVLPLGFTSTEFGVVKTQFNTALPERGANLTSPVSGAILRWRIQGAKGGPFFLRVLRPTGTGAYTAVGTSGPAIPTGTGLQTFTASIPIRAGDLIGVDPTNPSDEIGVAAVAGASTAFIFPPPFDGSTVAPSGVGPGEEIQLSAEVQPLAEVSSLSPGRGSIAGGTKVVITGENLAGATAVKFGEAPAETFAVDSETQITATTPKVTAPGEVDVTITTAGGVSETVRSDRFSYTACVVPKLKGKKLKADRVALRKAGCKLGKVSGARSKTAKVVRQSAKPGKVLPRGAAVNVRLG